MSKKLIIGALVALGLVLPVFAGAFEFRIEEQPVLGQGEAVIDDLYIFGETVTSNGTVTGDVIGAGRRLLIEGVVSGDAMLAGETVTVTGDVDDDVRAVGSDVVITGRVGSDVMAFGQAIQLAGEQVGGDVFLAGEKLNVNTNVSGDVKIYGAHVVINGAISGNVEVEAEDLTLGSSANITGNLTYSGKQELVQEEGAVVQGEIVYTERKAMREGTQKAAVGFLTFGLLLKFLSLFATALFFGLVFKRYSNDLVNRGFARPLRNVGLGLASFILLPILGVLLLVTLVGIPLGILTFIGFVGLIIMSMIFTPVFLGSLLWKWMFKGETYEVTWQSILLGVFVYLVLGFLPIVGWLAVMFLVFLTAGSMMAMKWNLARNWR